LATAPRALDAVPAGHARQLAMPSKGAKEPASHGEQSAAVAPPGDTRAVPAGQKSGQMIEPGELASAPGAHARHVARPPTGLNEPGGQGFGGDAPGQNEPASHGAHVRAPAPDDVVGAHGAQAVAPRSAE
jgi:hypothetical protein